MLFFFTRPFSSYTGRSLALVSTGTAQMLRCKWMNGQDSYIFLYWCMFHHLVGMAVGRILWGAPRRPVWRRPESPMCRVPCPCAASSLTFSHLSVSVSTLWSLITKKEPDFASVLGPGTIFKVFLYKVSHWIDKGIIGSWEEKNIFFFMVCLPWPARMTGERRRANLQTVEGCLAFWQCQQSL